MSSGSLTRTYVQALIALALLLACMAGCKGGGGLSGQELIEARLPAVPGEDARANSAALELPLVIEGSLSFQHSTGSRADGSALELNSAEGEAGFVIYSANLLDAVPSSASLQAVFPAETEYWAAVPDHSTGLWVVSGPFSSTAPIPLGAANVDALGNLFVAIAVEDGNSLSISSLTINAERAALNVGYDSHMRPLVFRPVCMNCHDEAKTGEERYGAPGFVNWNSYELAIENAEFGNIIVQVEGMPPPFPHPLQDWQKQLFQAWIDAGAPEGVSGTSSLAPGSMGERLRAVRADAPDFESILGELPASTDTARSAALARPLIIPGSETAARSDDSFDTGEGALRLEPDSTESGFALYTLNLLGGTAGQISVNAMPDSGEYWIAHTGYESGEWLAEGPYAGLATFTPQAAQVSSSGNLGFAVVTTGAALTILSSSIEVARDSDSFTYEAHVRPQLTDRVCSECHREGLLAAGRRGAPEDVNFDSYSATLEHLTEANDRIQAGEMPPQIAGEFLYSWQRELFQRWADNEFAQ